MISYIEMCISIDGTAPLVDTYREIDVTLVFLKMYNRVPNMPAHVIFLYLHLVNNISM